MEELEQIKKALLEDKEFLKELSRRITEDSFINKLLKEASDKSPTPIN